MKLFTVRELGYYVTSSLVPILTALWFSFKFTSPTISILFVALFMLAYLAQSYFFFKGDCNDEKE